MASQSILSRFQVKGLRGTINIDAQISDNTLILVGENGSGKTTFLRIMFYFLSGRFHALKGFDFDSITATINGIDLVLRRADLASSEREYDRDLVRRLPPSARSRFHDAEASGRYEEAAYIFESYFGRHVRSSQIGLFDEAINAQIGQLRAAITDSMGAQILYLPTYRRIERELNSIFSGMDVDDMRKVRRIQGQAESDESYIELVEFGMGDVQKSIDSTLENIRGFANAGLNSLTLSYLGDVVNQDYLATARQEIADASPETVSEVLNRVGSTILNDDHKQHLREIILTAKDTSNVPTEHEQIIYHYFTKLLRFQSRLQERERNIKSFCDLCSNYIIDKKFVYDGRTFAFRIEWAQEDVRASTEDGGVSEGDKSGDVKLSDLSSGEKQIVSLFSHLYLSSVSRFFVLIDEPELSLSVPWQRRFLEDIRGGAFCSGIVAVTHSPFIYDNSLRKNTHALGEFVGGPDWGYIR